MMSLILEFDVEDRNSFEVLRFSSNARARGTVAYLPGSTNALTRPHLG